MTNPDAQPLSSRLRAWTYLAPALLWTGAFFVLPLAIMGVYSLWQRLGTRLVTTPTLANYRNFLARDYFLEALLNSLEVALLFLSGQVSLREGSRLMVDTPLRVRLPQRGGFRPGDGVTLWVAAGDLVVLPEAAQFP